MSNGVTLNAVDLEAAGTIGSVWQDVWTVYMYDAYQRGAYCIKALGEFGRVYSYNIYFPTFGWQHG